MVMMSALMRRQPQQPRAGAALEAFFCALPPGRIGPLAWIARHPARLVGAVRSLRALTVLEAAPGATPDGRVLATGLARRSPVGRLLVGGATSVIRIPDRPDVYSAGHSRRTLRKQRNEAVREGVHWMRVDDPARRRELLELANEGERTHPDARDRTARPDNQDLLPLAGWWLALSAAEEPLLLAVAAIDGEWAMLRYFRVLHREHDASKARFLMMQVLVQELAALGVQVLATDMSPVRMPGGLRDFQHRVGFELVRIRTSRARIPAAARRARDLVRSEPSSPA